MNESKNPLRKLLDFLARLDENNIWYKLGHYRDTINVEVDFPGEKWEVEFFDDGQVEFERFVGDGKMYDENALEEFLKKQIEE